MSAEIRDAEIVSNLPAVREQSRMLVIMPVMDVNTARHRLLEFQEFCAHYLQESQDGGNDGGDFGVIPGTKKKTLLKSGADKLCEIYGLYDEYESISTVENWDKGLFDYTLKCVLKSRRDDSIVGTGVGSCSSFESKYRWREAKRACPQCGKATIIAGKAEYGGGFICWKKDGRSDGCGAKFKADDKSITDQIQGRIENPDIIDAKNTVLKMAKKRAKIDATIGVTRSSGIFTQDMDDIPLPPAEKPKPAVTTEDIPLGAPVIQPATVSKGTAKAPVLSDARRPETDADGTGEMSPEPRANAPANFYEDVKTEVKAMQEKPAEEYPGCIDKGRQIAFARAWKDAMKGMPDAVVEKLRKEWLGRHNYTGDDGVPTSAKIPLKFFEDVKKDAVTFARGLKA